MSMPEAQGNREHNQALSFAATRHASNSFLDLSSGTGSAFAMLGATLG